MAQLCEVEGCGKENYRIVFQGGKWRGEQCGCSRSFRIRTALNPFNGLVLQHAHDEFGQPLAVSSVGQLSRLESRYGFEHVVLNYDGSNANDPPQQRKVDMHAVHNWKFSKGRR